MENIGPVYFTEASPGKYDYLDPDDKRMYETNVPPMTYSGRCVL